MGLIRRAVAWLAALSRSRPGDWATPPVNAPAGRMDGGIDYDADRETEELGARQVPNPVLALHEAVQEGRATISEAWLFEGRYDERGRLLKGRALERAAKAKESDSVKFDRRPYRSRRVVGKDQFLESIGSGEKKIAALSTLMEAKRAVARQMALKEGTLIDDSFIFDGVMTNFDPNQYTEYTPMYGGPHTKQLYLTDYLTMHARAFETWNHMPLGKRIINLFSQYAMGRSFQVVSQKQPVQDAWDEFEKEIKLKEKVNYWVREYCIYGELMVDTKTWSSIDPSTVWDIITDPDDITDVYYYYQSYPTAYQTFTGMTVPGVSGAKDQKPIDFIVRQLPYDRVIHIKTECVSNEKRGRSKLFPVLGWLKRVKDLYNAQVIGEWTRSSFIWDDTINGSAADISAHIAAYNTLPLPGSIFAHNKAIERKVLAPGGGGSAHQNVGGELLAFIATGVGIPKDFFNVMASGGGSRATALVGAEPFSKVIEEIQGDFERLFHQMAERVMAQAGVDYKQGDLEFIFPSVTKDTTTETVKNILQGEAAGYISKETAGSMYGSEMNITTYDFKDQQAQIKDEIENDLTQSTGTPPPGGRFGQDGGEPGAPGGEGTPIAGDGAANVKDQLGAL